MPHRQVAEVVTEMATLLTVVIYESYPLLFRLQHWNRTRGSFHLPFRLSCDPVTNLLPLDAIRGYSVIIT